MDYVARSLEDVASTHSGGDIVASGRVVHTGRLTLDGEKVARQLAMTDDAGQDALTDGLLGEGGD
jgi:hypothetical protein